LLIYENVRLNEGSGSMSNFPLSYLWEFGSDTSECAYNLETTLLNGKLVVTLGSLDFYRSYST